MQKHQHGSFHLKLMVDITKPINLDHAEQLYEHMYGVRVSYNDTNVLRKGRKCDIAVYTINPQMIAIVMSS